MLVQYGVNTNKSRGRINDDGHPQDASSLFPALLVERIEYNARPDLERLTALFRMKMMRMRVQTRESWNALRVVLAPVSEDGWDNLLVPILLNGRAEVYQELLDCMESTLRAREMPPAECS